MFPSGHSIAKKRLLTENSSLKIPNFPRVCAGLFAPIWGWGLLKRLFSSVFSVLVSEKLFKVKNIIFGKHVFFLGGLFFVVFWGLGFGRFYLFVVFGGLGFGRFY